MKQLESSTMSEGARKARNEYMKRWRKKHPDLVREYAKRRWERIAEEARKRQQDSTDTYSMISEKVEMR